MAASKSAGARIRAGHFTASTCQLAWVLAALMSSACIPTFDDDLSILHAPRVLAVQSSPAEAKPGDSVVLSALVALPDPSAAAPDLDWALCVDRKPLTELGPVNPSCLVPPNSDSLALLPLGAGAEVSALVPKAGWLDAAGVRHEDDACRLFGPNRPEPKPGETAGRPVDPDPTGGYYQPVTVALAGSGNVSLGSVRLACPLPGATPEQSGQYNARYRPNQNPELARVTLLSSGDPLELSDAPGAPATSVSRGAALALRASFRDCPAAPACGDGICGPLEDKNNCAADCTAPKGCTGAETYAWFDPETRRVVDRRESIRVSWFASAGSFQNAVTGRDETETSTDTDNVWTAPDAPGAVTLWLVIRDARGGQSFRSFRLAVGSE
jgi:hypothetical protein